MKFQKGMPRPANAGRKAGTPNKKTIAKVADFLAEKGINPAEKILSLIDNGSLEARDELKAWLDLLSYCQAKPKPVEEDDSGDGKQGIQLTPEQFKEYVAAIIQAKRAL